MSQVLVKNTKGSVALTFGLVIALLIGLTGSAVDFGRLIYAKSKAQSDLDAAALAAVISADQTDPSVTVHNMLSAVDYSWDTVSTTQADNTVTVTGTVSVKSAFLEVIGIPRVQVTVLSAASLTGTIQQPSTLQFGDWSAKGWDAKVMKLHVIRPDNTDEVLFTLTYQPTVFVGLGSGIVTASQTNAQLDLGSYTKIYEELDVTDFASGQLNTYRSDVQATDGTPNHLFPADQQLQVGMVWSNTDLFPCGQTIQQAWEDSSHTDYLTNSEWQSHDVFVNVTTQCAAVSTTQGIAHLVR